MEAASEQDIVPTWVANMWTSDTACLACLPRIMLDVSYGASPVLTVS